MSISVHKHKKSQISFSERTLMWERQSLVFILSRNVTLYYFIDLRAYISDIRADRKRSRAKPSGAENPSARATARASSARAHHQQICIRYWFLVNFYLVRSDEYFNIKITWSSKSNRLIVFEYLEYADCQGPVQ